jgi:hypothetical protein
MFRNLIVLCFAHVAIAALGDFLVAELGPYFDTAISPYDPQVAGTVVVTEGANNTKATLTLTYHFTSASAMTGTTGGIHIHVGTSCGVSAGGHYFDDTETSDDDSWNPVKWTASAATGPFSGVTGPVYSGYDMGENEGHVVVVHNANGTKIACGKLTNGQGHFAKLGNYPGYTPADLANTPRGVVMAGPNMEGTAQPNDISLEYHMAGFTASQSSGLHIHAGMTCVGTGGPGGHYWDASKGADNWNTTYTASAIGFGFGKIDTNDFYPWSANVGHTVVVHDGSTKRACGVIGAVANVGVYPGYTPVHTVKGQMRLTPKSATENTVSFTFTGLPPSTTNNVVHIHSGTNCSTTDTVGGHFYAGATDPWNDATLVQVAANSNGVAIGSFDIAYGKTFKESLAHTVVVHVNGTKVACGVLTGDLYVAPPAAPTAAPNATAPTAAPNATAPTAAAPTAAAPTTKESNGASSYTVSAGAILAAAAVSFL